MRVLGKGLHKGVGLGDAVSDTEEFKDAEEHLEEVFGGPRIRGDQGPDSMADEFSPLALSEWPGIFSDDVSWRLVMYPCSLMMIGSCLAMFWFYFSLLLILSFSSRPSCCCTVLRGSLSCCSTGSSRPSGVSCRYFLIPAVCFSSLAIIISGRWTGGPLRVSDLQALLRP